MLILLIFLHWPRGDAFLQDKKDKPEQFDHVYMLQDLDMPGAERIKELEALLGLYVLREGQRWREKDRKGGKGKK